MPNIQITVKQLAVGILGFASLMAGAGFIIGPATAEDVKRISGKLDLHINRFESLRDSYATLTSTVNKLGNGLNLQKSRSKSREKRTDEKFDDIKEDVADIKSAQRQILNILTGAKFRTDRRNPD